MALAAKPVQPDQLVLLAHQTLRKGVLHAERIDF
jgi:hypothetical protein